MSLEAVREYFSKKAKMLNKNDYAWGYEDLEP